RALRLVERASEISLHQVGLVAGTQTVLRGTPQPAARGAVLRLLEADERLLGRTVRAVHVVFVPRADVLAEEGLADEGDREQRGAQPGRHATLVPAVPEHRLVSGLGILREAVFALASTAHRASRRDIHVVPHTYHSRLDG